ncbi:MAG: hypothetical protein ABJG47_19095 [Ekhidna sp.]
MKKNILIVILTLVAIFFLLYSFIKADEAEKSAIEAQVERERAVELQNMATEAAAEAQRQTALAVKLAVELKDCQAR